MHGGDEKTPDEHIAEVVAETGMTDDQLDDIFENDPAAYDQLMDDSEDRVIERDNSES